jgi:REP element-mobilizing transposase RayT
MSYKLIYYHIVLGTKVHKNLLSTKNEELYKYIRGIIKNKSCHLYRINGTTNHLHIFSDLHPTITLADYIKEIKRSSSVWLKENNNFPNFDGWAEGYASMTVSHSDKNRVIEYIN